MSKMKLRQMRVGDFVEGPSPWLADKVRYEPPQMGVVVEVETGGPGAKVLWLHSCATVWMNKDTWRLLYREQDEKDAYKPVQVSIVRVSDSVFYGKDVDEYGRSFSGDS